MIDIIKKRCTGCTACFNVCPKQCISMKSDEEGFLYPIVNNSKCINCGLCEKVCPIITGKVSSESSLQLAYAAKNKSDNIRLHSTSGGVFSIISEYIIKQHGIVVGAAFSKDFKEVHHIIIDNADDIKLLRGSKYVQSYLTDIFCYVKKYLDEDRYVLFSGTPCQIGGLISFLGKDYEKLLTVDLICHGVPSPKIWKIYLSEIEKKYKSNAVYVNFRNKDSGWSNYSINIKLANQKEYKKFMSDDLYLQGFVNNLYLRPSCHECTYKTLQRQSDMTLGDFWGINDILPGMNDEKGTSLILIHTSKGLNLFHELLQFIEYKEVNINKALIKNPSATISALQTKKRKQFWDNYQNGLKKSINKLIDVSIWLRLKIKLYRILSKYLKI